MYLWYLAVELRGELVGEGLESKDSGDWAKSGAGQSLPGTKISYPITQLLREMS